MKMNEYIVRLIEYPEASDWDEVRRRALVTMDKTRWNTPTTEEWKHKMLRCRHSPIRKLNFAFYMEIPSWVATHFARHKHAQPYIASQRNDRQSKYDRDEAPQGAPVKMIIDMNAEELMIVMNKRLCSQASQETRYVARLMRKLVEDKCPEFKGFLVPMCEYTHECYEMFPCLRAEKLKNGCDCNGQEE